ncbi:MAG: HAD-IA family hydrolase [Planctomycetes bacterium]|nr:HAD-IA family hydrolase [Planctomycetota bacterium]
MHDHDLPAAWRSGNVPPMPPAAAVAVVFDLDGTLVDSLEDIALAMNDALVALGRPPHAVDAYRAFVGRGVGVLAARALGHDDPALTARAVDAFRRGYAERLVERTRPYPGVPALLDALAARGVPAAVLTNKPEPAARALVERLLGAWRWAAVIGDRPGLPRKPDPTGALEAARALGAAPGDVLLVGDSDVDVETARAAGMIAAGAAWGFRGRDELEAAGAHVVVERPADVLELLRSS